MDLLANLPNLPPDELRAIRDRVTALLAFGGNAGGKRVELRGGPENEFLRDLYEGIASELERRHRAKQRPWSVFAASADFAKQFRPAAQAAYEANAQWFPKQSKSERMSMARLYAKLCIDSLEESGAPVVWPLLNRQLVNLPAVLETAFPGYARAGLLAKVQQLRTSPR